MVFLHYYIQGLWRVISIFLGEWLFDVSAIITYIVSL